MREFFTLHQGLPREGPGEPSDIAWALDEGGIGGAICVVDAACGPGADLVALAEALPEARIEGVELRRAFVDAARLRVAGFGDRVTVRQGDMVALDGPVDFIWCAGALYFLGVETGLRAWAPALAPGGHVCFTEPVFVSDPPVPEAQDFWSDEDVTVTDLGGIVEHVRAAGFRLVAARYLQPSAWAAYYLPMAARIAALRPGASSELAAVLDQGEREIALWRAAPDQITYAQLLVAPR